VDFRTTTADPGDLEERHGYRYQPGREAAVTSPSLLQNQRSSSGPFLRKGSIGPDDPMITQVPPRDHGWSYPECIDEEASSLQHPLVPTLHQESRIRRSPDRQYSDESHEGLNAQAPAGEDTLKRWLRSTTTAITTGAHIHHRNDREDDHDQLLMALSRLHEARTRINELELVVADAATQSERTKEKLSYVATPAFTVTGRGIGKEALDTYARFEQELKLSALERGEANELVKNVCAVLKSVVQQQAAACAAEA